MSTASGTVSILPSGSSTAALRQLPGTAPTTSSRYGDQEIICAVSESRAVSPTVALAFVNVSTGEAVLGQFTDTQSYARACHKISVFAPSEILYVPAPVDTRLISVIAENMPRDMGDVLLTSLDQHHWNEVAGHDYLQHLALADDVESLTNSLAGMQGAKSCLAAVMAYLELACDAVLAPHSLRIKFETAEQSAMINIATVVSLELVQNLQDSRSRHCLYGLLNKTRTPMGARCLRSNILQPSTNAPTIAKRHAAVAELVSNEAVFFAVDADRVLAALVVLPATLADVNDHDQAINQVLRLKKFVDSIMPAWVAITAARSEELAAVREACIRMAPSSRSVLTVELAV